MKNYELSDLEKMIQNADEHYQYNLSEIKSCIDDEVYSDEVLYETLIAVNVYTGKTKSKKKLVSYALSEYMRQLCECAMSQCDAEHEDLCKKQGIVESVHGKYMEQSV
jgi:HSP90 family molecular chaperone